MSVHPTRDEAERVAVVTGGERAVAVRTGVGIVSSMPEGEKDGSLG